MYTFDVLVSKGALSDGSTCYGAWCSYVRGVWAQGDTEEEALETIKLIITDVINDPEDLAESLVDAKDAEAEMADLTQEYDAESITWWRRSVSVEDTELANI